MKIELLDLETGETILRMPIDAREIIATGQGRYCYPKDAPKAQGSQPAVTAAAAPPATKSKRDNKAAVAAMLAANASRRAAKKQAAAAPASQE